MAGVDGYVQAVDRVLAGARALFPEAGPGLGAAASTPTPPVTPDESSGLGSSVLQAATGYQSTHSRAGDIAEKIDAAARTAHAAALDAGGTAVGIRSTAATHAAAVRPEAGSPEAVVLLVTRMDEHLAKMQEHITSSKAAMMHAARQLRGHREDITALGRG